MIFLCIVIYDKLWILMSHYFNQWGCSPVQWLKLVTFLLGCGLIKCCFFSVNKIFNLAKVPIRFFESHSYLTVVPATVLRWHLSNISMTFNRTHVCLTMLKNSGNNGTEEIGLVTSSPGLLITLQWVCVLKRRCHVDLIFITALHCKLTMTTSSATSGEN